MLAQAGLGSDSVRDLRLRGVWLLLARLACGGLVLLAVGVFAASIPAGLSQLGSVTEAERVVHPFEVSAEAEYFLDVVGLLAAAAVTSICFILAGLIFYRRSDHPLGLLTPLLLAIYALTLAGPVVLLLGDEPASSSALSLASLAIIPPLVLFLYLFPDGRFVPPWTRWLAVTLVPWTVATLLVPDLRNQGAVEGTSADAYVVQLVWYLPLPAAGIVSQLYRYRGRLGVEERQQVKWVLFGVVATMFLLVASGLPALLFPPGEATETMRIGFAFAGRLLWNVAVLLIPLSISVAVLRYRLWDIDFFVNRSLVYVGLTGIVFGIYVLLVGALGAVVQARVDLDAAPNVVISLVATGLIAVLFEPLRGRLQRSVNRLMYGDRDDPYAVVSRLGRRLEATVAPEAVLPTIVETVAQALKLPYAAIALQYGGELQVAAGFARPGAEERADLTVPLVYQGEAIGQLLLGARGAGETFTPGDRGLLEDLARQAGVVAHSVGLAEDLQRSRRRLVTAREEERRRLRRDLHDGLGPALASLTLKLDAARNLLTRDPLAADALLAELKVQTQAAVADIRRLVYELRPPALDQLGLSSALVEHASQYKQVGLRVEVEAPDRLPPLPAAVEVAAYRIAVEALTNVARHSRARTCTIRLSADRTLRLDVTDDGVGIQPGARSGVGMASMRERAAELGGRCLVERIATGGTRVLAELPLLPGEA